jgi:hypothetical protein
MVHILYLVSPTGVVFIYNTIFLKFETVHRSCFSLLINSLVE